MGVSVTGTITSATNSLAIANNAITLSSQLAGSNPTTGILISKITGTTAASIINNTIGDAFYGYLIYNLKTTPVTTINGGTISGVMQGLAAINIDPAGTGVWAPSTMGISNISMSGFIGNHSALPNSNFHAGVYVFTGGNNASDAITATVDKVSVTGNRKDCSGLCRFIIC